MSGRVLAKVTIISGAVNSLIITDPGSGYQVGENVELDPATLGGGSGARFDVGSSDIENSVGVLLQISGGGLTTDDSYAQIVSVDIRPRSSSRSISPRC